MISKVSILKLVKKNISIIFKIVDKVAENQSNINNLVGKFLDENGNVTDTKGYHKAMYAAENVDKIALIFMSKEKQML